MLLMTQACVSSLRSSSSFVASLEGQLAFTNSQLSDALIIIDFSDDKARIRHTDDPVPGILSPDGEWELLLIHKDTNDDGIIDQSDRSHLYLSEVGSSEEKRVNLPYPVGTCIWSAEYMIAICSFAASDVNSQEGAGFSDNAVLYLVDVETGELLRRLSDPTKSSWDPDLSPDGNMIAFRTSNRNERQLEEEGIQIVDIQTGNLIYEIVEPYVDEPTWSPDGTRLAFVASIETGEYSESTIERMYRDVFYVDLRNGLPASVNVTQTSRFSEVPAPLTELGGIWVSQPVWSPDGQAIASVWTQDNGDQIWVTSVNDDSWAQLTQGPEHLYHLIEWRP